MDGHELGEFYGLSTISQDVRGQGAKAANMLVDLLENADDRGLKNVEQVTEWPIELMIRSSTAKRASN